MTQHWTERSTEDFVYRIASDFALQIETKMNDEKVTQAGLAERLGVTDASVSQVLRNPGNFTLKKMAKYARSLGLKVAVVAYEDSDPENKNGPINSQIFAACWTKAGKPTDFFSLRESTAIIRNPTLSIRYVADLSHESESVSHDTQLIDLVWQQAQRTTTSKSLVGVR